MVKVLKNKPLVEAIFELRWDLQERERSVKIDPHYKLLIGRLYDKLSNEYRFYEQLPTATMPDEIAGYVVQHRFRKGKNKWPLVQVGPGIITVNDTEGYTWQDFEKRTIQAIGTLFGVYPQLKYNLKVNRLVLRYIDAIAFDFEKGDIFSFLRKELKTRIELHHGLFDDTGVKEMPSGFDLKLSFSSTEPEGTINLRFARGTNKESDALLWETVVQSASEDAPQVEDEIAHWIKEAHNLTDSWFFKLIEGKLLRRFE